MRKIVKNVFKAIAGILGFFVIVVTVAAVIIGSLILFDVIKERGGNYYENVQQRIYTKIRDKLAPQAELKQAQFPMEDMRKELESIRDSQLDAEQQILEEFQNGEYTFTDPLIINDPYGISPLTALVLFRTEEPERISIYIAGDTKLADVSYTFKGYQTDHVIPVYGLYPDRDNQVRLTSTRKNGEKTETVLTVSTEALPANLSHENIRAYVHDEDACQPGFTFTLIGNNNKNQRAALDANGVYRWCLDLFGKETALSFAGYAGDFNDGNSLFFSIGNGNAGNAWILEFNLLGKLLNAWHTPYGVHHDIAVEKDSIWVTGGNDTGAHEALLSRIDRNTGKMVSTLDFSQILQPLRDQTRFLPETTRFYSFTDWCHMNSVDFHGADLVVSCRNQSTVLCTDREGNIKWMLCDPTDYLPYFQQFILTPVGEDFRYSYSQHAADVLPDQDGNPDTVDILLFDNGDFRKPDQEKASRMVQYRINEKEMTVEQIWSYGGDINEIYSQIHGDADLLKNGNRLGSFEPYHANTGVRYAYGVEVNEEGGVVWECWRTNSTIGGSYNEYRLERLEIYSAAANDLQLGTAANLLF